MPQRDWVFIADDGHKYPKNVRNEPPDLLPNPPKTYNNFQDPSLSCFLLAFDYKLKTISSSHFWATMLRRMVL